MESSFICTLVLPTKAIPAGSRAGFAIFTPNPAHSVWSVGRVWLRVTLAELPGEMGRGGEHVLAARLTALSSFYLKNRDSPYRVAIRALCWCVEDTLYLQPSVSGVHVGWNRALHQTPVWYFLPLECFFHFLPWW